MSKEEDKTITLTLSVGQVNQLLTLLGELPFNKSADAIFFLKKIGDEQLQAIEKEEAA
jgi:hypothetical protein